MSIGLTWVRAITVSCLLFSASVCAEENNKELIEQADSIVIAQLVSEEEARAQAPTYSEREAVRGVQFVVSYGWKQPTYWRIRYISLAAQPNDTQWVLLLKKSEKGHHFEIIHAVPYQQSADLYSLLGQPEWTFTESKDVAFY